MGQLKLDMWCRTHFINCWNDIRSRESNMASQTGIRASAICVPTMSHQIVLFVS